MTANELRIGNLVNELNIGVVSVRIVDLESIKYGDTNYKPIPLTEEWLLKFGFKKRKYKHLFIWENKITISQFLHETHSHFSIKTGFDIRFTPILESIHQLQNLYFALTGEELTIN